MSISICALIFLICGFISSCVCTVINRARTHRFWGSVAAILCVAWTLWHRFGGPMLGSHPLSELVLLHGILALLAFWSAPKRVLERPETPLVFLLNAAVFEGLVTNNLIVLCLCLFTIRVAITFVSSREVKRHANDPFGYLRRNLYIIYGFISLAGLTTFAVGAFQTQGLRVDLTMLEVLTLPDWAHGGLAVAMMSSLAIFPFHSWLPVFIAAPRRNLFVPLFVVEAGILVLLRLFVPLSTNLGWTSAWLSGGAAIGAVYVALLLFGEKRLKRIVGYLILGHLSLMVLTLLSGEGAGDTRIVLDAANVLIAGLGLFMCVSILTSRFGMEGVVSPSGLAKSFPEVAACFLVCSLSLVGFPGTIGFMSEEVLIQSNVGRHALPLVAITIAVALNGYSCFRLFARLFYGTSRLPVQSDMRLGRGERAALLGVIGLLIAIGLAPGFFVLF